MELKKASQGYDFGKGISVIRGYSLLKYNSFNLLCKKYLYRIFPIRGSVLKALTGKSHIHPYFCQINSDS